MWLPGSTMPSSRAGPADAGPSHGHAPRGTRESEGLLPAMEPAKGSASSTASARSSMKVRFVFSAGSRRHLHSGRSVSQMHRGPRRRVESQSPRDRQGCEQYADTNRCRRGGCAVTLLAPQADERRTRRELVGCKAYPKGILRLRAQGAMTMQSTQQHSTSKWPILMAVSHYET